MPALEALRRELGLRWPVTIRIIHGDLLASGRRKPETHGMRRTIDGRHVIEIRADLGPEVATSVLAHEFLHCAQAERHGDKWAERYRAARDAYDYRCSHFEVAARTDAQAIANRGTTLAYTASSGSRVTTAAMTEGTIEARPFVSKMRSSSAS